MGEATSTLVLERIPDTATRDDGASVRRRSFAVTAPPALAPFADALRQADLLVIRRRVRVTQRLFEKVRSFGISSVPTVCLSLGDHAVDVGRLDKTRASHTVANHRKRRSSTKLALLRLTPRSRSRPAHR